MTLGVIDMGTNSVHLLIVAREGRRRFRILLKARALARVGEGGLAGGMLTSTAMHRAMRVLRQYRRLLQWCGVDHVEAVASSAVRETANGRAFVRRVRTTLGLPLRVISGREEARLIALGVLGKRSSRGSTMVISIGGGSAQVTIGDAKRLRYATSVPLGCARLAQRFLHHDPPQPQEVERLRREVRRVWAPAARRVHRYRWQRVVGSSATIHQVMAAAGRGAAITQDSLRRFVRWLAASSAAQRRRLPGLDPERQDMALPTGVVLLVWMETCGISSVRYAPGSLREGLIFDDLHRRHPQPTCRC